MRLPAGVPAEPRDICQNASGMAAEDDCAGVCACEIERVNTFG